MIVVYWWHDQDGQEGKTVGTELYFIDLQREDREAQLNGFVCSLIGIKGTYLTCTCYRFTPEADISFHLESILSGYFLNSWFISSFFIFCTCFLDNGLVYYVICVC